MTEFVDNMEQGDWEDYRRKRKAELKANPLDDAMPSVPSHGDPTRPEGWRKAGPVDYALLSAPHRPRTPIEDRQAQAAVEAHTDMRHGGGHGWVKGINDKLASEEQMELFPAIAKGIQDNLAAVDMVNLPPHYARFKIEPISFIGENKLDWFQGNIVKYVLRHDAKNGIEDIDKVIRYAQMYRKFLLGDENWWRRP